MGVRRVVWSVVRGPRECAKLGRTAARCSWFNVPSCFQLYNVPSPARRSPLPESVPRATHLSFDNICGCPV
eukprot:2447273-Prymnesium_polylepis.1